MICTLMPKEWVNSIDGVLRADMRQRFKEDM
jgi:hypothetical protein